MTSSHGKRKRFVPLARCSTASQIDTSLTDQLNSMAVAADERGIELLDPHLMPGQSGSLRRNLEKALDAIIARKVGGEPIDGIMVYDLSRFGRSGPYHFGHLMIRLEDAGLELQEVVDHVDNADFARMFRLLKSDMAHRQARYAAENSARGSRSSLEEQRRAYCSRPPYGIDAKIIAPDGQAKYVRRELGKDRRVKLDPATGEVMQVFKKGQYCKKDKMDRVILIPGEEGRQEIVRRIFREYFLEKQGSHQIAKGLNDEHVPGPEGGRWSSSQIMATLKKPIYTGYGLAGFYGFGIYYLQNDKRPKPLEGNDGYEVRQIRPREDWLKIEYDQLVEYLPEDVRVRAIEFQEKYLDSVAEGHVRSSTPRDVEPIDDSRRCSSLLGGILMEKETGKPMRGDSVKGTKYRYYRLANGCSHPSTDTKHLWQRLPMGPIDRAVLEEIEAIICGVEDLRPAIIAEIQRQDEARRGTRAEVDRLNKELAAIERQVDALIDQLGGDFGEKAEAKLNSAAARKKEIGARLAEIDAGPQLSDDQVEQMTDEIIANLSSLIDELAGNKDASLRLMAETFVSKAVAEMKTREVDIEIAIPARMFRAADKVGLTPSRGPQSLRQTNKWAAMPLASVTVDLSRRCDKDCHESFEPSGCDDCRRQRKAA